MDHSEPPADHRLMRTWPGSSRPESAWPWRGVFSSVSEDVLQDAHPVSGVLSSQGGVPAQDVLLVAVVPADVTQLAFAASEQCAANRPMLDPSEKGPQKLQRKCGWVQTGFRTTSNLTGGETDFASDV